MSVSADDLQELQAQLAERSITRRPTVPALEEQLFQPIPCLDHGFVRVVDYMGDDAAVVQAARVSYGKGTRSANDDRGLIRYLLRHRHTTPLEMCELKLHVKLPIFVARQWIRHRTANVNEHSARYSIMDREFYLPRPEDLARQSANNKQGRGETLDAETAEHVLRLLRRDHEQSYDTYEKLIDDAGLARELARMNLSVGFYTQWYWKVDLHNLLHFLALRIDPHAQYEIRVYGEAIANVVKAWVPHCWEAFQDYRLDAFTLSGPMLAVVRRLLAGEDVGAANSGLSKREWTEMMGVLRPGDTR
ncbi:MAG: FAD-dependent thymidylate synthase [Myxococcales bacterium]|nr:FAD-dependent thymidylate synthase [Myxococcales bacterium]